MKNDAHRVATNTDLPCLVRLPGREAEYAVGQQPARRRTREIANEDGGSVELDDAAGGTGEFVREFEKPG